MIPAFSPSTWLPPGLHSASLREVEARFSGNVRREARLVLLREVVNAALNYASIKRVLVWGSFVSNKAEPNDLDYSLVVDGSHKRRVLRSEDEEFLLPATARFKHGVDPNYLLIEDFDFERYVMRLDFLCTGRDQTQHGIIEISLRGERRYEEVFN